MAEAIDSEIDSEMPNNDMDQQLVEDEVTIDMKEMIQYCGDGLFLPDCCIYRVPTRLCQLNKEACTPQVVSIGPFHYHNERLQDMETHKRIMFKRFTQRAQSNLDNLVRFIKHLEPKVRASYSDTIKLFKQELVKLTLTNVGFIIQLFIMVCVTKEVGNDAKLSHPWLLGSICLDLLLVENQLLFFIVEELFIKAFPQNHHGSSRPSFLELTYVYFGHFNHQNVEPNPDVKIKHFTDLLRSFYLQGNISKQQPIPEDDSHVLLYKALQEAGIKLKPTMGKCLDLKLSGHNTLEIPQFLMDDSTELVFCNVIAFEQCHYPRDAYITDYVCVLDRLIDTYKDVDLLVDKKIVRHYLGDSHNVASLFNGLWVNVVQSKFNAEYLDICQRLNGFCQDPWNKKKATLKRDYCNISWRTVASIAGIILLVLTIVQTMLSVLQVVL